MELRSCAYLVSLILLLPATGSAGSCPDNNLISDPQAFVWQAVGQGDDAHFTGVMEIAEATLTVGGETITTRVYRQAGGADGIPGPTLLMQPGNKYVLQFRNTLPYEPKSQEHNIYKDPNVSNLHTHGLHTSGESPGDDVTRSFEGGAGGDFVYDIPADHMGGTFWYHAHHHGSTFLQVSGGAFGMLIIDDSQDNIPENVAAMEERQLVVAYLDPDVAGTGGDTLISGSLSPTWTVNGKVDGDLCMPPDTWQHWRVLLADRQAYSKILTLGPQCEVALLARDGVWRTEVPKELPTRSLSLTGASRVDLAVRCSGDATIAVAGVPVAKVFVDGPAHSAAAHPYAPDGDTTWFSQRPSYLRDLRSELISNTETVVMSSDSINGKLFDHDVATFTIPADRENGVQQWTLNGASNHPFHLHVYPVQIKGDCGAFEDGEYYDVVADDCTIHFDLGTTTSTPYSGRTIMHCHILAHEDLGAMGWLNVVGGLPAPAFPAGFGYTDYISPDIPEQILPVAPTQLVASTVSSSEIYLSWLDLADNEDLFDIERSLGNTSFAWIDAVGADAQSYQDKGLEPNTEYRYRVRAVNGDGHSDYSNISSDITDVSAEAGRVRVRSITVSAVHTADIGQKRGRAVVVVENDQGEQVSGATVSGTFTGSLNDIIIASDPTDANGMTTIDTTATANGRISLEFCVTAISHPALADFTVNYESVCGTLRDGSELIELEDTDVLTPGERLGPRETR